VDAIIAGDKEPPPKKRTPRKKKTASTQEIAADASDSEIAEIETPEEEKE